MFDYRRQVFDDFSAIGCRMIVDKSFTRLKYHAHMQLACRDYVVEDSHNKLRIIVALISYCCCFIYADDVILLCTRPTIVNQFAKYGFKNWVLHRCTRKKPFRHYNGHGVESIVALDELRQLAIILDADIAITFYPG